MIANLPNYYRILGVLATASPDEIKSSYKGLVQTLHPDKNASVGAVDKFQLVVEAYQVLSDATRRREYDSAVQPRERRPTGETQPVAKPGVVEGVTRLLGGALGELKRRWSLGQDLRYTLDIDLRQACLGGTHDARFEAPVRCPACRGRGQLGGGEDCRDCSGQGVQLAERVFKVTLAPGTTNGQLVRVPGGGTPGERGGPEGDLTIVVAVRPHPLLEREENNLCCRVPLPITTALAGGHVRVPTLEGGTTVKVPEGVVDGDVLRLDRRGVALVGGGRGDLLITLDVELPSRLTAAMRRLLVEAEKASPPAAFPQATAYKAKLEALDE